MPAEICMDKIVQIGIVTRDIRTTNQKWADFFLVKPAQINQLYKPGQEKQTLYREGVSKANIYQSLYDFQNIQIELIQPLGEEQSVWKEFLEKEGEGLHHIAFFVRGTDDVIRQCESDGMQLIQRGGYEGGQYSYVDATGDLKVILEFLENE